MWCSFTFSFSILIFFLYPVLCKVQVNWILCKNMKNVWYTCQWFKALVFDDSISPFYLLYFLHHHTSVLVPQPGMEAVAPAVEMQILNHWTARLKLFWRNIVIVCGQLCLTLCNPMDCSRPGFSVHGILQAKIPEQVAISYFRGSSWSRDQTCISCVSCIDRQVLYH